MDFIIEVIVFVLRELLGKGDSKKGLGGDSRAIREQVAQASAARGQAMRDQAASRDPVYDDSGWRRVAVVVALTVLIAMVAIWFTYIRGWLPSG